MNIDIKWDNQKRDTLVCDFSGDWTWHECREAMQVIMYMQDGTEANVNHVYDLSQSTLAMPACMKRLQKLLNLEMNPAPKKIVIVDKSFRVHTLRDGLTALVKTGDGISFAESLESARANLAKVESEVR